MSRIEQRPDGSYVRRLTYLEEQLIKRLYQEINERKVNEEASEITMTTMQNDITVLKQELSNLKQRFNASQQS